ncbi:hypothetical protein [Ferrimonas balearica]|uniref:hypothetical protein n=1 Tax=Ferrimonas balearica TaxID=44012 RepID=UPI001F16917A|nr:hypothetical protein [Ferrimonas balearica]MBY6019579.1 hypothetical protein [Halomonas denitrificans]MBY6096645.1 hypothetical protein [Ferrimonas balearica]
MTVPPVLDLLTWLHLGIALFGGINCLLLALFLRYLYRDPFQSEHYLAAWFGLLSLYFGFSFLPSLLSQPVLLPLYGLQFLALPCLYLYLNSQWRQQRAAPGWHFVLPSGLILAIIALVLWRQTHAHQHESVSEGLLVVLLPLAAVSQYAYYLSAALRDWQRWGRPRRSLSASGRDLRRSWLMVLATTASLVWLLRLLGTLLPLLWQDPLPAWLDLALRLAIIGLLLFSLAFGLRQISNAAWLRRHQPSPEFHPPKRASESILNSEELAFLRDLNRPQ